MAKVLCKLMWMFITHNDDEGTCIKVDIERHEMLGSAIGSRQFTEQFVSKKIEQFVNEIESLAKIAERYPQSAYAAFSHCIISKWRYIMRTVENIDIFFSAVRRSHQSNFCSSINWKGTM